MQFVQIPRYALDVIQPIRNLFMHVLKTKKFECIIIIIITFCLWEKSNLQGPPQQSDRKWLKSIEKKDILTFLDYFYVAEGMEF